MEFAQLRDGLLLFHRNLLEKAEKAQDPALRERYTQAAKHLREVIKHLAEFDKLMKEIKQMEGSAQAN